MCWMTRWWEKPSRPRRRVSHVVDFPMGICWFVCLSPPSNPVADEGVFLRDTGIPKDTIILVVTVTGAGGTTQGVWFMTLT